MPDDPTNDLTRLFASVRDGDLRAEAELFEAVYGELHRMARGMFQREKVGHTLQPTILVHEAWMRLGGASESLDDRARFFGAAARAMQRILVDHARRTQAAKRDGGVRTTLADVDDEGRELLVLDVDDALDALEKHDPRLAEVVRLRFFGGLTVEEIASVTERSTRTVKRDWTYARAWLFEAMGEE